VSVDKEAYLSENGILIDFLICAVATTFDAVIVREKSEGIR
jgi:hypothetical protein